MTSNASPEQVEDVFFAALRDADVAQLQRVLTDDFLIVDVMGGSAVDRNGFVGAFAAGVLSIEQVDVVERVTREHGDAAIIVGRTQMAGTFAGTPFAVASRYTHVLLRDDDGGWRLASAQGTPIADAGA